MQRKNVNPVAYTAAGKRVIPLTMREATMLIAYGYAEWRGRKKGQAVTVSLPVNAVLGFVGQIRLRPRLEAGCLDSKTHVNLGGLRGYAHRRNSCYDPILRHNEDSARAPLAIPESVVESKLAIDPTIDQAA